MEGHPSIIWLARLLGVGLILLALLDVFMAVLYARVGTGPLSHRLASGAWAIFRWTSRRVPGQAVVLSYFGSLLLVMLICVWLGLLLFGFTFLAWPSLGRGIVATAGPTPTDFMMAFHYAGSSLTTVGSSDLQPKSAFFRLVTVIDSIVGMLVLTMAVTYVIQVYSALHARNALAMTIHHASGGSGDAAQLLASLGPGDDFSRGQGALDQIAAAVTTVYESHHFYSVLIYFRFPEPQYAMSRGALVNMELVSLIATALDESQHGWLSKTSCVTQIREATMHVLGEFAGVYLPGGPPGPGGQPAYVTDQWRRRFRATLDLLRERGISTTREPARGEERYVELRRQWDGYVFAFARYMEHEPQDIDPVGVAPQETGQHREMPIPPLRAAG